ncbi:MAG: RecX family transcriptional regulator, partial [Clostridiales bacterium]|nr:RecX family transcriptional regulator [Clostridiales bacterium]
INESDIENIHMMDDEKVAYNLLLKKYGKDFDEIEFILKAKMSKYLSQRGFTFDTIKKVVNLYEDEISKKF